MVTFVSVDAGNGYVNASAGSKTGKVKKTAFPSIRADAPVSTLGPGSREVEYDYVDWLGHTYTYGSDTVRISANSLERHHGPDRYGDEFHAMLVAIAMYRLKVKDTSKVSLTLFMPPGLCTPDKKRDVIKSFSTGLHVTINGKKFEWFFDEVIIHPEGLAAMLTMMLSPTGKQLKHRIFDGEVLVADVGTYTLDVMLVRDGSFDPATLDTATHANDGMYNHILSPLLARIHQEGGDFTIVTSDMVDKAIYEGHYNKKGEYKMLVAGVALDLTAAIESVSKKYAGWIVRNILDTQYRGLRGIKSLIVVGGGAHLITKHLKDDVIVGDKVLEYEEYSQLKGVRPTEMNSIGGLRWARHFGGKS